MLKNILINRKKKWCVFCVCVCVYVCVLFLYYLLVKFEKLMVIDLFTGRFV